MDYGSLQHQLLVALDDLDQSKDEVQNLKENIKDAENFIQSLKEQLNKSILRRERNLLIR